MQNKFGIKRPPKPNWGDEITLPSEIELINENIYKFSIDDSKTQHIASSILADASRTRSPTEEYLEMTRRLIDSKSLSPRTSMILENLYVTYKSIQGYGLARFDSKSLTVSLKDSTETELYKEHEETDKSQTHPRKDIDGTNSHEESKEKKQFDTLSVGSRKSDKLEEKQEDKAMKRPVLDPEPPWFTLKTIPDPEFGKPCDPETFKIENIFSDFSLFNVGHDKELKERIRHWMLKEGRPGAIAKNATGEQIEKVENIQ